VKASMTHEQSKHILVVGAGAIGGYVGGCLAADGHRVVFLCTPPTSAALRSEGLRVKRPDGDIEVRPEAVTEPEEAFTTGDIDLAVVAVKRYDTEAAAGPLKPFAARIGWALTLQNGLGAETDLGRLLGMDRVLSGTITTAVARASRRSVAVERMRGAGIAGVGAEAASWSTVFDQAGLNCRRYTDPADMQWSKLLTNLIANPTSAILDMTPAEVFAHPGLYRLEIRQLRETLAVMAAAGARVVDLPGTPVRLLAFCAKYLPPAVSQPLLARALGRGRGGKMPSFHADLHSGGARSEIDYYHGAVVRAAGALGIPVPVNRLLTNTFTGLLKGQLSLTTYLHRPDRLLAQLPTSH
jgi:2-dehydropantoate 2-reductase